MSEGPGRVQRARWYMPRSVTDPIRIEMNLSPLELVVVTRTSLAWLSAEWETPGAYLLLDPPDPQDTVGVYVGKAQSLRQRVQQHVAGKPDWRRAVLIRNKMASFHNAEAAWLEGRLHLALDGATHVALQNLNRPGDDTLSEDDRDELEAVIPPVLAVLRVLGLDPDTRNELAPTTTPMVAEPAPTMRRPTPADVPRVRPSPAEGRTRAVYPETLHDLVRAGLLPPGSVLVHDARSPARATITSEGLIDVDGRQFDHPSPAAVHLSANFSENGWRWWSLRHTSGHLTPLRDLREQLHLHPDAPPLSAGGTGVVVAADSAEAETGADGPVPDPDLVGMLASGAITSGLRVVPMSLKRDQVAATIDSAGFVWVEGTRYSSLDEATTPVLGHSASGWTFWCVDRGERRTPLVELRDAASSARPEPEARGSSASPAPPSRRPRQKHNEIDWPNASIADLIKAGRLQAGQRLRRRYKGQEYEAFVRYDGTLQVGQKTFQSISASAESIATSNTNGWKFWRLEDGRDVSDLRKAPRSG